MQDTGSITEMIPIRKNTLMPSVTSFTPTYRYLDGKLTLSLSTLPANKLWQLVLLCTYLIETSKFSHLIFAYF